MTREDFVPPKSQAVAPSRRLVVLLVLASLFGGVARLMPRPPDKAAEDRSATTMLAGLRIQSAASVGRLVLTKLPELRTDQRLVDRLLADLHLDHRSVLGTTPAVMTAVIASRVRRDFESGRIVDVAGWRFALTEARLCALAARLANRAG
jgi:hypothetical protein